MKRQITRCSVILLTCLAPLVAAGDPPPPVDLATTAPPAAPVQALDATTGSTPLADPAQAPGPAVEPARYRSVVTATRREARRRDVAGLVQVIGRADIEELHPISTGELLQLVTGTSVETGTGSGLPQRRIVGLGGLPANYTLVLVDGVRLLSDHVHTGQNLELIPVDVIERIEVLRGAASAQYGADAIGGVINIITRKAGERAETGLAAGGGTYGTWEGGVSWLRPLTARLRLSTFVGREESDGIALQAPAHRIGSMGYERQHLLARIDAGKPGEPSAYAWVQRVDHAADGQDGTADSVLTTGVIGATYTFGHTLTWSARLAHVAWEAEISEEQDELLLPETFATWEIGRGHTLTGGADLQQREYSRTAVAAEEQRTIGAFVQYEWQLLDRLLTLQPALRVDRVDGLDPVPSLSASVLLAPAWPLELRASVGQGFHAPTPQELHEEGYGHGGRALRFGNPDLEPERSTTFTLDLELTPVEWLEVSLGGHYSTLDDMIVPVFEGPWEQDSTKDVWRRTNIAAARVWGGEARVRAELRPGLALEGGYTYTDDEDETGGQLPYHAGSAAYIKGTGSQRVTGRWQLGGFLVVKAAFDRSAWSWKPAKGAAVDDPSGLTTPLADYQQLDAGLTLSYDGSYNLHLNAYNLLGQDIENLDDAYTVLDGEPVLRGGLSCSW